MDENCLRKLARYSAIPLPIDHAGGRVKVMSDEEKRARRAYIRQTLLPFQETISETLNIDDDYEVDLMRLKDTDEKGIWEVWYWDFEEETSFSFVLDNRTNHSFIRSRKRFCNIPPEYEKATAANFRFDVYGNNENTREIKESINRFLTRFDKFHEKGYGFYIYSNTRGSGKTLLSCILLNELIERYKAAAFFASTYELVELASTFTPEAKEKFEKVTHTQILCIDDFGANLKTDWVNNVFYKIIDHRYSYKLPTIITSNNGMSDLKFDDRVVSRINHMCIPLHIPEISVRDRKSKQEQENFLRSLH